MENAPPDLGPLAWDDPVPFAQRVLLLVTLLCDRSAGEYLRGITKLAEWSIGGSEQEGFGRGWACSEALEHGQEPWKSMVPRALHVLKRADSPTSQQEASLSEGGQTPAPPKTLDPAVWVSSTEIKDKTGLSPDRVGKAAGRKGWEVKVLRNLNWYRRTDVRDEWPDEGRWLDLALPVAADTDVHGRTRADKHDILASGAKRYRVEVVAWTTYPST